MKLSKEGLRNIIREELAIALKETVDPTYNQRYYNMALSVAINRKLGGEREETLREIRGIPGVTTVSVVPESVAAYENKYRMQLNVKFALLGAQSLIDYQSTVFMTEIKK